MLAGRAQRPLRQALAIVGLLTDDLLGQLPRKAGGNAGLEESAAIWSIHEMTSWGEWLCVTSTKGNGDWRCKSRAQSDRFSCDRAASLAAEPAIREPSFTGA